MRHNLIKAAVRVKHLALAPPPRPPTLKTKVGCFAPAPDGASQVAGGKAPSYPLWLIRLWDGRQSAQHCTQRLLRYERPISPDVG